MTPFTEVPANLRTVSLALRKFLCDDVANVHKQVLLESCCYLTTSHANSHPRFVSLFFIPSLYFIVFNSKNFLFTGLPSFFMHTCAQVLTIIVHQYTKLVVRGPSIGKL